MLKERAWIVGFSSLLAGPLAAQVWTQQPGTAAALARYNHAAAYDFLRGRLVVFGGQSSVSTFGDTLEYDGTRWTTIATPVAPQARWAHGMAFDFTSGRVVLFGGQDSASAVLNDTWEWNGTAWQLMPTVVAPTPRMGLAMTTDPFRGGVLVHGGRTNTVALFGDLWLWSGGQWQLLDNTGPLLCAHSMAIDPHNGDLVLFGGWDGATHGDTWIWNITWRLASSAGPSPRWGHRMASDLVRSRIVMSGGLNAGTAATGETWVFVGQQWFRLGDGPVRYDHVLDHDIVHGLAIEAGGYLSGVLDVWSFGGAAAGTIQTFGQGCGSGATPTLAALTAPRLGTTLQLNTSSTPGTTVYLLGFSASTWNTLALPLDLTPLGALGCVLYVEPAMIDVAVPSGGATAHAYAVPNDTALVGVEFFAQTLAADPAANPAGVAASNALAGTIGP